MHSAFIQRIMRKPGALPWFTHNLDFNDSTGVVLSGISICYRWGLGHNIFMVVFGRYSVKKNVFNLFVSSKGIMPLNWSIHQLLSMHQDELRAHPLQLVGLLLEICERFIDLQTQEMNRRHLQVARRLGVSHDDWLGGWHIDPANEPDMSRFIYIAYDWTSWLIRSCRDLISIGEQFVKLADKIDTRYGSQQDMVMLLSLAVREVQDVINRAEMDLHMLDHLERVVSSHFESYNNLLAREESKHGAAISEASKNVAEASWQDSRSMKTVSYLTMAFLPTTFVSAIFSTTVFDFQNWTTREVVSPGWWVLLLTSGLVTVLTLSIWFVYQQRERERIKRELREK